MDDLISRQAAIDIARDVCDAILSQCGSHYDGDDEVYDDLHEVDAVLKCNKEIRIALANMPSVQPDMSEYSDRLWKLAYERGKRDALQEWIPVTEALPKEGEEVIVTCLDDSGDTPFGYTTVAWHYKGMWVCGNFVIAWMPLPDPYKEGKNV